MLFWHVQVHFDCAGSQNGCPGPGARPFPYQLAHKIALLTCPCVHVPFDCAGSHQTVVPGDPGEVLPKRSLHDLAQLLGDGAKSSLVLRSSFCGDPVQSLPKRPCIKIFKMLCMVLYRALREDLVEILVRSSLRGPCMKILQLPCLTLLWKLLWEALGRFLSQDLVSSAPAAAGPFMTILWA